MRIVITGAAGTIGRQLVEELSPLHELRLIDRSRVPGRKAVVADLSRKSWWRVGRMSWQSSFEGAGVVIHLAADVRNYASWECVLRDNIQVTWNVIEAAARYRVPRVVFASSNWVVKALEQRLAPACYQPDGPKIGSAVPPQPMRPYGISKALGEAAGQAFVDQGQLRSFVVVRIGWYAPEPDTSDERLRALWLGVEDTRSLFRRCVEANIKGFHVVYGVSAQKTAPYDLSHTQQLLSWFPRQIPDDQPICRTEPT